MSIWIFLFFTTFSLIKGHSDDLFQEFKFSEEGKTEIKKAFGKLWKQKIFLTEDDLELNLKNDILPWKPPTKDKIELKKRRFFRNIINNVKKNYIHGWKSGHFEKKITYPIPEDEKNIGFITQSNDEYRYISRAYEEAKDVGIKEGWIITDVSGHKISIKVTGSYSNAIKETEGTERILTFLVPTYDHFDTNELDDISLSEFELLLDMDFLGLSDAAKAKVKDEL